MAGAQGVTVVGAEDLLANVEHGPVLDLGFVQVAAGLQQGGEVVAGGQGVTWTPWLLTVQVAGVCRTSGSGRQVVATSAGVR